MKKHHPSIAFRRALSRRLHIWRAGLGLDVLLRWVGAVLVIGLAYALLDCFMALGARVRVVAGLSLGVVLLTLGVSWLLTVMRLRTDDMARHADVLLGGRRRPVLTALELNATLGAETAGLQSYLVGRSSDRALQELGGLSLRRVFPAPRLKRRGRILALQAAVVTLAVLAYPVAARVLCQRLVFPLRDTPPYSAYRFEVTPAEPTVVYGDDLELGVRIAGKPVKRQVWFLVRHEGQVHRRACFQESEREFAQRLEQVVSPVSFCFSTGKARSPWQQIRLQLQPEVATARVVLTPPAYTGLPARNFAVGKELIEGLPGSLLKLEVMSNRPLRDGQLRLLPTEEAPEAIEIAGQRVTTSTLEFSWTLDRTAALEIDLRDVQGTRMRAPYRLRQTVVTDALPRVSLSEPGPFVLATPNVELPVRGEASDRLGLQHVTLVRTVVGFRDRAGGVPLAGSARRCAVDQTLDLARVGVEPGQVLEFYLEATDTNPSMLGVAVSDIARVQIISDEEYAVMLRARSSLEEFSRRYQAIADAMQRARDALREVRDQANRGADPASLGEALKRAAEIADEARKLYEQLGTDFPIFDTEPKMAELLKELAGKMQEMAQGMRRVDPAHGDAAGVANSWLNELGAYDERFSQEMEKGEEVLSVARVMQMAMVFRRAVMEQEALVRGLQRLQDDTADERRAMRLQRLAARQEQNRERLAKFSTELGERMQEVDAAEYAELLQTSQAFLDALAELGIGSEMDAATRDARSGDRSQAEVHAERSLELMRSLLSKCRGDGGMGDMCQNRKPKFGVGDDPVQSALNQMYQALRMQFGQTPGGGSRPGTTGMTPGPGMSGGDPNDGYSTSGYSPLNLPLFGPGRSNVPHMGRAAGGAGRGAPAGAGSTTYTESESMSGEGGRRVGSESIPLEAVPEKYRDAVRRFYGDEKIDQGHKQ